MHDHLLVVSHDILAAIWLKATLDYSYLLLESTFKSFGWPNIFGQPGLAVPIARCKMEKGRTGGKMTMNSECF